MSSSSDFQTEGTEYAGISKLVYPGNNEVSEVADWDLTDRVSGISELQKTLTVAPVLRDYREYEPISGPRLVSLHNLAMRYWDEGKMSLALREVCYFVVFSLLCRCRSSVARLENY